MKNNQVAIRGVIYYAYYFSVSLFSKTGIYETPKLIFDKNYMPYAMFMVSGHQVYAMVDTGSSTCFHLQKS